MTRSPTTEAVARGRWFLRLDARADAELVCYCLPHAGAGASAYRGWAGLLPPWADVAAVTLPGRERRIAEPPSVDPAALADAIAAEAGGRPFALFGHSMGGLLAFEVARVLTARGLPGPVHLGVSAVSHPCTPMPSVISTLPDDELLAWLRAQGTSERALADRQVLELLLPPLQVDSAWAEQYTPSPGPVLTCDISVFAGELDERTRSCDLTEWAAETSGACVVRRYPGGHFYLADRPGPLVADLVEDLTPHRGPR